MSCRSSGGIDSDTKALQKPSSKYKEEEAEQTNGYENNKERVTARRKVVGYVEEGNAESAAK